jgi:hypothetical protein
VRQVWYPANKDAKTLPFPSAFMSRDWVPDPEECTGVGEVYGASRNFNYKKAIPGATGEHICGTADQFAGLAKIDHGQDVKYRANGLPVCCGVGALVGGLLVGGRAAVNYTPPVSPPTPGNTCVTAPLISIGTVYGADIDTSGNQWWKFTATSSSTRIDWLENNIIGVNAAYRSGVCPNGLTLVPFANDGLTRVFLSTVPGATYWIAFYTIQSDEQTYRFRLTAL